MMYSGFYQYTRVVLYMYIIKKCLQNELDILYGTLFKGQRLLRSWCAFLRFLLDVLWEGIKRDMISEHFIVQLISHKTTVEG